MRPPVLPSSPMERTTSSSRGPPPTARWRAVPIPPCGPRTSTRPRAARRPRCPRKARTLRCLETPTCGTEPAPGRGGQIGGPGPWKGSSPRREPALSAAPSLLAGPGRGRGPQPGDPPRLPVFGWASRCPCLLLSVCGVQEPALASCQGHLRWPRSSQIVLFFLGWRPASTYVLWSLERDSCNLGRRRRRFCPGPCSSVRSTGT